MLSACGQQESTSTKIAALEKASETNANPDSTKKLIALYLSEIEKPENDAELKSRYLYRVAALNYRQNRIDEAETQLHKIIKDYNSTSNTPNALLLLADIYQNKSNQPVLAQEIYTAFATKYPEDKQLEAVKKKMKPSKATFDSYINDIGDRMYDDSTFRLDNRLANNYISSCRLFAALNPDAPNAPELLFKAGETSRTLRRFKPSIEIYDWIINRYPNFDKASQALFLKGFTMDNDLKKHQEAKLIYESFLKKYPDDDFVDDTKFLLNNIGKTDEEIIKNFEGTVQ